MKRVPLPANFQFCVVSLVTVFRGSVSSSAGDTVYETVEDRLRKSINTQRRIKEAQIKMSEDHQKMRDLSINIKSVLHQNSDSF